MRLRVVVMAAGAGILALLSGFWQSDPAVQAVEEGNRFYRDGDYAAALERYAAADAHRPGASEIRFDQGTALARMFAPEAAAEHLTAAAEDPALAGRLQYNLGVVKYRQALESLQTFQDAMSFTQAAIRHWRASLEFQPDQEDARYNLELAYRLLAEIEAQQVQAQRDAGTRNQQTSDNRGQPFKDEPERPSDDPSDRDAPESENDKSSPAQGHSGSSRNQRATEQAGQIEDAGQQEDLSPEAAEELLEVMRERAINARNQRQARQQVRIRTSSQDKYW